MHYLVMGLFVIAALLGVFMLSCIIRKKPISKYIPIIHGTVAGCGLVALISYTINHPSVLTSLILLGGAALGGIYMLITHLSGKTPAKIIPFVHGSIGIIGLILLIYYIASALV